MNLYQDFIGFRRWLFYIPELETSGEVRILYR